ncbi:ESX secretion-associated protein EspG [Mycobacterium sp.]|uniref:ESX secretion-associated protein EspG n=1 Tax=Mycobacterium sp. TaxID=1785 RepID=UPI003A88937D
MLTTTVDGLWALQVLAGIETVAPELGLRPHLPSVESWQLALRHPIATDLRAAGVIDDGGNVDTAVLEWLTVLSRRDIALCIDFRTPGDANPPRALLARFAQWWVALERDADLIRISPAGTAHAEDSASAVLNAQIERLCGPSDAARLRPVTLDTQALRAVSAGAQPMCDFLGGQGLDPDQLRTVMLAADDTRSAKASIVAIQSGVATGRIRRTRIEQAAVTIIDTPEGRVVVEEVRSAGREWNIISPGSWGNIAAAVDHMVRRLPADREWYSYRKVV